MAQFLGADAAAAGGASLLHPYIGISMRCSFCALRRLPRVRCLVLYPALSVGHFLSVFLGIQKIPGSEEPGIVGAPEGIRTPNLLIRSQMLYPIELRVHLFFKQQSFNSAIHFFLQVLFLLI